MTTTMTTLNAAERSLRSKMANAHGKTWEQEILALCDAELLQMQHVPPACTIISAAPPRKNGYSDPRLRIVRLEKSRSVDFEGFLPLARRWWRPPGHRGQGVHPGGRQPVLAPARPPPPRQGRRSSVSKAGSSSPAR
jgi:hypothetical protein